MSQVNRRRATLLILVGCCMYAGVCLLGVAAASAKGPQAQSSVVGGIRASLAQWGFTVAIADSRGSLCTGSVISPTRVVTAAHCVGDPSQITVRANSTAAFFGGETRGVVGAAIHPGFNGIYNDIAVLSLSSATTAPPIPLANASDDAAYTPPGNILSVAGFGVRNPLSFGKPKLGVLTAVTVFTTVSGKCRDFVEPATEVCDVGGRFGTAFRGFKRRKVLRGICSGDSGGPLVADTPSGPRLLGVAEAGISPPKRSAFGFVRCGLRGFPGIHIRIAPNLGFIQSQL
jgi:secreted trypsin-like serine protease